MNDRPSPARNTAPGRAPSPRLMHGALRLPLLAVLMLVLVGGAWWWRHHGSVATQSAGDVAGAGGKPDATGRKGGKGGAASVVVAKAARRDFEVWLDSLGTVTPLANVTLRTRVDGELVRVLFREGQMVRKGDLLAEIDPRSFQATLDQALATLARDQALLENAHIDLRRYQDLTKQDAIPHQQLDTQESLVRQYEASVRADQASIDSARLQLSYCRITAPVSGQIGLRLIDAGNIVHAGDVNGLVTIAQMQPISALFSLPQDQLPALHKRSAHHANVKVLAMDRAGQARLADGALSSQDNQIDPTTGTLKLRAGFANQDGSLYPNQFVNVRVLMEVRKDAVVIPASALQRGTQGPYVYLLRDDQTVAVRQIRPGPADHGEIVVEEGLAAGDQVVIDGTDKLRDGMPVNLADRKPGNSAGNKGAGKAQAKP